MICLNEILDRVRVSHPISLSEDACQRTNRPMCCREMSEPVMRDGSLIFDERNLPKDQFGPKIRFLENTGKLLAHHYEHTLAFSAKYRRHPGKPMHAPDRKMDQSDLHFHRVYASLAQLTVPRRWLHGETKPRSETHT